MKRIFISTGDVFLPALQVHKTSHGLTHAMIDGRHLTVATDRVLPGNAAPNIKRRRYIDPGHLMRMEAETGRSYTN